MSLFQSCMSSPSVHYRVQNGFIFVKDLGSWRSDFHTANSHAVTLSELHLDDYCVRWQKDTLTVCAQVRARACVCVLLFFSVSPFTAMPAPATVTVPLCQAPDHPEGAPPSSPLWFPGMPALVSPRVCVCERVWRVSLFNACSPPTCMCLPSCQATVPPRVTTYATHPHLPLLSLGGPPLRLWLAAVRSHGSAAPADAYCVTLACLPFTWPACLLLLFKSACFTPLTGWH